MSDAIEVYDTTLRDGGQALGVNLSLADKLAVARCLDKLGVAYIEGGWPGSNQKDAAFFRDVRTLGLKHTKIAAFGSTRHRSKRPEEDDNLRALVESAADVCCIFGKAWDLHVKEALRVTLADNLEMVRSSVAFLAQQTAKPVFFDAEHFFDGFADDSEYALEVVTAAHQAGAARVILCETNGGALPDQVADAVRKVLQRVPGVKLGIHVHNDGGLAVANTLAAVQAGAVQVQGTINGIGERCGNVDLTTVIANLELKLGRRCLPDGNLSMLAETSRRVWDQLNLVAPLNQPFVGESAFAHKGGVHVSAMQRNRRTYEHIRPEAVGNERRILVSEMSGRSNLVAKLSNRYPKLRDSDAVPKILDEVQQRENEGYSFESADASLDLIVRRHLNEWQPAFELDHYRVYGLGGNNAERAVEATVKLQVAGDLRLCVAEGTGPVDALSHALLLALRPAFPTLNELQLVDFRVRVVNVKDGASAKVRVVVEHRIGRERFTTLGVHQNIIEASWLALVDAAEYALHST